MVLECLFEPRYCHKINISTIYIIYKQRIYIKILKKQEKMQQSNLKLLNI